MNTDNQTTMTKQKTAIQQSIEKMTDAENNFPAVGFSDEFIRGFNKAFQIARLISKEVGLPKEREQIIVAYTQSIDNESLTGREIHGIGLDYFNETYEQ